MNNFHSYLDTSLRIIHINRQFGQDEISGIALKQHLDDSENSRPIRHEIINNVIKSELSNNPELLRVYAHEYYHYLQGIFYPFLYYISWLELDNLIHLGKLLRDDEKIEFQINEIHMGDDFSKNSWFLYQFAEFVFENNHLVVRLSTSMTPSAQTLTLNDLLEDATSIFEYSTTTEHPNAEGYLRWQNNPSNNCYKKTYRLLLNYLGHEKAFDLIPLCVQVAFTCTEPYTGFCFAVNYINLAMPNYKEYSAYELFKIIMVYLEKNMGVVKLNPKEHHFINDIPVGVIRFDDMEDVVNVSFHNPLSLHYPLSVHLKKLINKIKTDPSYQTKILNFESKFVDTLMDDFTPYAVHYHFKEFNGRNGALNVSEEFLNKDTPLGMTYREYIREYIKIKEVLYGLLTRSHSNFSSMCHHSECPYFELGLCKFYNSLPSKYEDCGFPSWFAWFFQREINLNNNSLVKIDHKTADAHFEAYKMKAFKKRAFDYKKIDDGYLLTLDPKNIEDDKDATMFTNFITYLIKTYCETHTTLCAKISLDFYGYNDDQREVFKIPQIKKFIIQTKQTTPEFLYYINFASPINHKLIIMPILVEHRVVDKGKDISVLFKPEASNDFLLKEATIWYSFMFKNKIGNINLALNNIKNLL